MRYGTIIKFLPDKKFGFIRDAGKDIFFHVSAFGDDAPAVLKVGQPVEYELMTRAEARAEEAAKSGERQRPAPERPAQPKAKRVALIAKLPGGTLSEFDGTKRTRRHPRARQKKPSWRR